MNDDYIMHFITGLLRKLFMNNVKNYRKKVIIFSM